MNIGDLAIGASEGVNRAITTIGGMQAIKANQANMENEAAIQPYRLEEAKLKLESLKQENARLNSSVDITKFPVFIDLPEESKKTVLDYAPSVGGKPGDNGGYIMTRREANQLLNDFESDPAKLQAITIPMTREKTQELNSALDNLMTAKEKYRKAEAASQGGRLATDPRAKQALDEAQSQYNLINNSYQDHVSNISKAEGQIKIKQSVLGLQEIGAWEKLPDEIKSSFALAMETGDADGLEKMLAERQKQKTDIDAYRTKKEIEQGFEDPNIRMKRQRELELMPKTPEEAIERKAQEEKLKTTAREEGSQPYKLINMTDPKTGLKTSVPFSDISTWESKGWVRGVKTSSGEMTIAGVKKALADLSYGDLKNLNELNKKFDSYYRGQKMSVQEAYDATISDMAAKEPSGAPDEDMKKLFNDIDKQLKIK